VSCELWAVSYDWSAVWCLILHYRKYLASAVYNILCLKFGYSYMWYCATPEEYLLLATFGAIKNCRLLFFLEWQSLIYSYEKLQRGQSAQVAWGWLAQFVNLPRYCLVTYWLISLKVWYFPTLITSYIMSTWKRRADSRNTRLDELLPDMRTVCKYGKSRRSRGKNFHIPFLILTIYCDRVQKYDVKCTSPTPALNRGYIQHI
jgi:hypothetical protein